MSGSGEHPMRPAPEAADTWIMTVLSPAHDTRRGRFGRRVDGDQRTGRRLDGVRDDGPMDLGREMKMQELRQRIERHTYEVDPRAVADAIVARLLVGDRPDADTAGS